MMKIEPNMFRSALLNLFVVSKEEGKKSVVVIAGDLHRTVGGYPGPDHRMPICCRIMREAMGTGDEVISEPPSGQGASLTVRYILPRDS